MICLEVKYPKLGINAVQLLKISESEVQLCEHFKKTFKISIEMRWIALISTFLFPSALTCLPSSSLPSKPYEFRTKIPTKYCIVKNCHNCYRAINNDFGGKQSMVVCSAMYHQSRCCDFYIKRSKGILFWIFTNCSVLE